MINLISGGSPYASLWKILEKEKFLTKDQFKEALKQAKQEDRHLSQVLHEKEEIPQERLLKVFSEFFGVPEVRLRNLVVSPYVLNLIPREVAEQHSVVIFKKVKNMVHVATAVPENFQTIEFIRKKTGFDTTVFVTTPQDIRHVLRKYKSELSTEFAQIIQQSMQEALTKHDSAEKMAHFVPIIRMVNTIVERALLQRASDIHIEPSEHKITIRFRIDGLLHTIVELPQEILASIVARIKLLSNLKIDEHRQPQDGRFKFKHDLREVAIRVSCIPTLHGPKMVLRLLDAQQKPLGLRRLGLNAKDLVTLKEEIQKPHGMILVTGPTGSGKTTTLYTLLRKLNRDEVNICTVEDPIEYGLDGVNQTQVNADGGITFATGLRSLLRQDPNILMVGEIRDGETADIAMNSAMTGHLVLSTLHTNNVFLTPQRLIEMGVEPFLASSVINIIIGQRLVRRICPECVGESYATSKIFDKYKTSFDIEGTYNRLYGLGMLPTEMKLADMKFSYGKGCPKCSDTGYQGRIGIYEILKVNEDISHLIRSGASADVVRKEAMKRGVLTMKEDGLLKVFLGQTTFEEVLRATKDN